MKTPPLALLNSLGFTHPGQKIAFAAYLLRAGLFASPAVTIAAAVPAVAGKPEIIAQTAKPARAATPAITGAENTTGYRFGELYLNSPAYPVGTPIPAIPEQRSSAEVIGVPGIQAMPLVPAIVTPVVTPIKGWEESVSILTAAGASINVIVDLPYTSGAYLFGGEPTIGEITPASLMIDKWVDVKASNIPESITTEPPTLEQYLYKYAKSYLVERPVVGSITKTTRVVNGIITPVKRINMILATNFYNSDLDSLQLPKIIHL